MQTRDPNNIKIIDVSHHQGTIEWPEVATSDIEGAYIKATEGAGYTDPQFQCNKVNASAAGLKIGFYHYCRPETGNTAAAEADAFINAVRGLPADFPHVLDVEEAAAQLGKEKLTAWCLEWLETVEKETGHQMMIYTGDSFEHDYLGAELGKYLLWVAHYGGVNKPQDSTIWPTWTMFQYSATENVSGISGNIVDMSEMDLAFWMEVTKEMPKQPVNFDQAAALKVIADLQALYGASADTQVENASHYAADMLRDAVGLPK